jgi:hypothetical protein
MFAPFGRKMNCWLSGSIQPCRRKVYRRYFEMFKLESHILHDSLTDVSQTHGVGVVTVFIAVFPFISGYVAFEKRSTFSRNPFGRDFAYAEKCARL